MMRQMVTGNQEEARNRMQILIAEDNPTLARSIKLRVPYIAPLNYLQIELIRRYRAGKTDEEIREGILMSINGVAAGLRNTG